MPARMVSIEAARIKLNCLYDYEATRSRTRSERAERRRDIIAVAGIPEVHLDRRDPERTLDDPQTAAGDPRSMSRRLSVARSASMTSPLAGLGRHVC